jgi:hypothetical protein
MVVALRYFLRNRDKFQILIFWSYRMKKNLALVSVLFAATLAACGGGGGSPSPAPVEGGVASTPPASTPPAPAVGVALDLAKAHLAAYDASIATSVPVSGTAALALTDGCSLNDGYSKALAVAEYDADTLRVASRQFDIGSTRTNVVVLAERTITNADSTTRLEIDVEYVINYKDLTKNEKATQTLISGSSSGSKLADGTVCTTPDNKADLRFFGNREIANTFVNASNERAERTTLATGLALLPAVVYSRYITLGIRDPAKVLTYATISGPGLTATGTAVGTPIALKLVSPRLLRDATEFAGKNGNFVDWRDIDSFRICRGGPGTAVITGSIAAAEAADCVANGAISSNWGVYNNQDPVALDTLFDAIGLVAGGTYTVKLYNDDGWKTVNGQLGKTPMATYTNTLRNLPMNTVALAGTVAAPLNKFPLVLTTSKTAFDVATLIKSKAAFSTDLTWSKPGAMPDGRATALNTLWTFEQGRATTGTAFNPASRQINFSYPAPSATAATLNVPAAVSALVTPTYAEATFEFSNRNGNLVRNLSTWQ